MSDQINIWLDDQRPAPDGFIHVQTVGECWELIVTHKINVLSLDNDLGIKGLENEGREIIKRLVTAKEADQLDYWPKKLTIQSSNTVALNYMAWMLDRYSPLHPIGCDLRSWTK